ncbi:MAG: fibronectin type III domain-containing protein, partial [Elusimicrobia bacterium]|nr:fibronectin type III domain-containing protein [bacterium]MCG2726406.1 fibronectin type III domain-containing protein [Elusimicrobiota bacterium]
KSEDGSQAWEMTEEQWTFAGQILIDQENRIYAVGESTYYGDFYIARYLPVEELDFMPPGEITDLAASYVTTDSVTLEWTATGDDLDEGTAYNYDIRYTTAGEIMTDLDFEIATQAENEPEPQGAEHHEMFTVSALEPDTTYYFLIRTFDEAGNSNESNCASAVTLPSSDASAPEAVSDLTVIAVSSYSIMLEWTAPGDDGNEGTASSYDIRYTTAGEILSDIGFNNAIQVEGVPAPLIAGSSETFTVTELNMGTTYYFAIKTEDEAENISELSNSPKGVTLPVEKYSISIFTGNEQIIAVNTYSEPMTSLVNIFGTTNPASDIGINFTISTFPAGAEGQELSKSSEATNQNGLASTQLTLGNIPAEYGVTATCNSCEASASSVTFTCCGKLKNDDFKQFDDEWKSEHYDNICSTSPAGMKNRPVYSCDDPIFNNTPYTKYEFNIRAKGCGLSALATVINYYRDAYNLPISSTTPKNLNTFLKEKAGCYTDKGGVNFKCVKEYGNNIRFKERMDTPKIVRDDLIKTTTEDINEGLPVILKISKSIHFILAIGICEDKFIVSDPGISNPEVVLYDPKGARPLVGIRRFKYVQ